MWNPGRDVYRILLNQDRQLYIWILIIKWNIRNKWKFVWYVLISDLFKFRNSQTFWILCQLNKLFKINV